MTQVIQGNEIVFLIIGIGVSIFIVVNFSRLKSFPALEILIAGFFAFFTGWVFTVLEGLFWGNFLNLMQHISYIVGSVLVSVWCWKIFVRKGD